MALLRLYLAQLRAHHRQVAAPSMPPGAKSTAAPGTAHSATTAAATCREPNRRTSESDASVARMT